MLIVGDIIAGRTRVCAGAGAVSGDMGECRQIPFLTNFAILR